MVSMPADAPVISVKIFEGFDRFLDSRGVSLAPLLATIGISPSLLADPDGALPLSNVCALFELTAQVTHDSCLGLHWAETFSPGATGVYGYAIFPR